MAAYKETPRQKMIAMMYLVLTALLALNVSVEILNAFLVVNDSMETTNRNYASKMRDMYNRFEKAYQQMPDKVGPYWTKAKEARKLSDSLRDYIDGIKFASIAKSERISLDDAKRLPLRQAKTKDRYDDVTAYFIGN
jgi:gliding motility-associated protein GldM